MKHLKVGYVSGIVVVVAIALVLATAAKSAQAQGDWTIVASPGAGILNTVATVSANDVWEVGFTEPSPSFFEPLTLHFDGTSWSVVSTSDV